MNETRLLVMADESHKSCFDSLFRRSGIALDYITLESPYQHAPLNPDLVAYFLAERQKYEGPYDGALICGCCADSLPVLTDKLTFTGKVIYMVFGGEGAIRDGPPPSERGIDLYVEGGALIPSEFVPQVREVLVQ